MTNDSTYEDFLRRKALTAVPTGIETTPRLSPKLKEHQRLLTQWALRRGRAAIFADTGLGKGWMILEWARVVAEHTGKPVLILAPLAVSQQFKREAEKLWGDTLSVNICASQADVRPGCHINIANYQKLHKFDVSVFGGVALDESSILKSLDGKTRVALIEAFRGTPFKLSATATPSPNDHTELGGQAEFLGIMSQSEMLATWFIHDGGSTQDWRLKGHARDAFWKWVCSWGAIVKAPSDLGCDDTGYVLPALRYHEHTIPASVDDARKTGLLFAQPAETLAEQRVARRATLQTRIARTVEIIWESLDRNTGESIMRQTESAASPTSALHITGTTTRGLRPGDSPERPSLPLTWSDSEPTSPTTTLRTRSVTSRAPRSKAFDATGSRRRSSSRSSSGKAVCAQSADASQVRADSTSTIATQREPFEASYATRAISSSADSGTIQSNYEHGVSSTQPSIWKRLPQWIIWVELNDEQDAISQALGEACVSVDGGLDDDEKEALYKRWANGEVPCLVTKSSIFGYGLNMQFCHRMVFVGSTHSFERFYQAVRRCWRFGQNVPVDVHVVSSELEGRVVENLKDKQRKADELTNETRGYVSGFVKESVSASRRETITHNPTKSIAWPQWLQSEEVA